MEQEQEDNNKLSFLITLYAIPTFTFLGKTREHGPQDFSIT